jgi:hypothetical protein
MKIYQLVVLNSSNAIHNREHFTSKKGAKAALVDARRVWADYDEGDPVRVWIEELDYPISANGMIEAMNHVAREMEVWSHAPVYD